MAGTNTVTQTLQSNIKQYNSAFVQNYSLFLGGMNITHQALKQYDPLKTGYSRIFFVRMPAFMNEIMPEQTKNFRHLLEYGFTKIDGIGNTTLETEQLTGGYAGKNFEIGTVAKDDTNGITVSLYEFAGSPVREYVDMWITGIADPYTGLGHYHGAMDKNASIQYAQYNHIAEAIYVTTDPTGRSSGVEYACLLCNMMPKSVKKDHLNYEAGQHQIVQTDIEFTAEKYESPQINTLAKALVDRFQTMRDYLQFNSQYTTADMQKHYKPKIANWPDEFNVGASN